MKGPVIVETIAQAFESARFQPLINSRLSISLNSIPDLVLWAGEEASKSRETMRGSSKSSSLGDARTLVEASASVTPITATTPTTLNTAVSDTFKALPDLPPEADGISTIRSHRPLSLTIPIKRSYSFSLSSGRRTSFVSPLTPTGRGKRPVKGFLRRFVIAWKRITSSNRLRRKGKPGMKDSGGARTSLRLPFGFELVDPKHASWWRRNSTSKRRQSRSSSLRQSKIVIDIR